MEQQKDLIHIIQNTIKGDDYLTAPYFIEQVTEGQKESFYAALAYRIAGEIDILDMAEQKGAIEWRRDSAIQLENYFKSKAGDYFKKEE